MKEYKRLTTKKYGTYLASCENCSYNNPSFDCDAYSCKQVLIKRLAELEDKIENGTLIELPCKVGDTVYFVNHYRTTSQIEEYKVYGFNFGKYGVLLNIDFGTFISVNDVCLTRAEAEAKLKEQQNER